MAVRRKRGRTRSSLPLWDALVFQGGGALGAYECGVYEALAGKGFDFHIVGGVSIGAANAAIVASRGRDAPTFLGRFWDELADPTAEAPSPDEATRRRLAAWKALSLGHPRMFTPRWISEPWGITNLVEWTNLYDPAPYRKLLERMVDFPALQHGPRRLLVTAVDVQSGELAVFDSHRTRVGVEHVLASGALPPAFPAVQIGERHYWDGGLVSNTPVSTVLELLPHEHERRIVMIELFPRRHHLPRNLMEVLATMKDLTYMDKADRESGHCATDGEVRDLLADALAPLPPKERERLLCSPEYLQLLQHHRRHVQLFVLTHRSEVGEQDSKDYDFSPTSLRRHREDGRHAAEEAVLRWERSEGWIPFGSPHPRSPSRSGPGYARGGDAIGGEAARATAK